MKFLFSFFVVLSIFIAGCGEGYELPKSAFYNGYDFTKYSAKGFLFTPEPYNGEYEAIGLIEAEVYPDIRKKKPDDENPHWVSGISGEKWYIGNVSPDEVFDSLYIFTKQMGADAVVKLEIKDSEPRSNGQISFTGIRASGFAIKRK